MIRKILVIFLLFTTILCSAYKKPDKYVIEAEKEGAKLAAEIADKAKAEADALCAAAREKLDAAVEHIVERVVKA